MIDDALIRSFCYEKDCGPEELRNPFNISGYTYASNGRIAIKMPERPEYAANRGFSEIDSVFKVFDQPDFKDRKWKDIGDQPPPKTKPCNECKGKGWVSECPDCDGSGSVVWESESGIEYSAECEMCDGRGHLPDESAVGKIKCDYCDGSGKEIIIEPVKMETVHISNKLLRQISKLSAVSLGLPHKQRGDASTSPIPFTFAGGIGVVMVMRVNRD